MNFSRIRMTIDNKFISDCKSNNRLLYMHLFIGELIRLCSFGIYSNKANIQHYRTLYRQSIDNYNTYKKIMEKDKELSDLEKEITIRGVRISRMAFSDLSVANPAHYGFDWEILRNKVLERDNYTCCKQDARCNGPLQIHHIRPLSKGGTNNINNLITLCKYHHSLKHEHMRK